MGIVFYDGAIASKDLVKAYGHFYLLTTYENSKQEEALGKTKEMTSYLNTTQIQQGEQEAKKLILEYGLK
jgi:hypothetical protein